ncbi:MAG: SBBP repeat-containing protein [Acidobacteriota bacterium]
MTNSPNSFDRLISLALALTGLTNWGGLPAASPDRGTEVNRGSVATSTVAAGRQPAPAAARAGAATRFRLPLAFEVNRGQTEPQVRFLARGRGYTLFLTATEAVLALRDGRRLRLELVGTHPGARLEGVQELPGKVNYFIGGDPSKWLANISTYAQVTLKDAYPGIDVVYRTGPEGLEYDLVVAPGADPGLIRTAVSGADRLETDAAGDLLMVTAPHPVRLRKPLVYQQIGGQRVLVEGGFKLLDQSAFTFELGRYDRDRTLVIDPSVVYSTYLGGNRAEDAAGIAVDAAGNAYVTGSIWLADQGRSMDVFVAKLNPVGTTLAYLTYLGGNGYDKAVAIRVDSGGSAYVAGWTEQGGIPPLDQFPTTPGAFQREGRGASDAFVVKLHPAGSALAYSTLLGGTDQSEFVTGLGVNASGSAYVSGITDANDFPTTAGAYQQARRGQRDVFVARLNATGTLLDHSTYLGGSDMDNWSEGDGDLTLDAAGNVYVTGSTVSGDFPTSPGAYQRTYSGDVDAFLAKLSPSLSTLAYSTYLGGAGGDAGAGIAVDSAGNAYVTGSANFGFPTTSGAFASCVGGDNAFVVKMNPAGTAPAYATCLAGATWGTSIAVDASGRAHVTGYTTLYTPLPLPATPDAFQGSPGGGFDGFLVKLNPAGSTLVYSTYLGGGQRDEATAVALAPSGDAFVTGTTWSTNFPVTPGVIQGAFGGDRDVFAARIPLGGPPSNRPPVAVAGASQTVECASPGGTPVTLNGSASYDPDGDPLTFEWKNSANTVIGNTAVINLTLAKGAYTFTLTVSDGKGGTASAAVGIVVRDTVAPQLSFTLSPNVLRPPNHRLVAVTADVRVSDSCDPAPRVVLVSITSNEPDNGPDDGDTYNDIQGANPGSDDRSFSLRAERSGTGTGRIYTVSYRALDASGNTRDATGQVTVPLK